MIKLENWEVVGWNHAIRGMRNPMNSWAKSDTEYKEPLITPGAYRDLKVPIIGPNDHELMMKLAKGGSVHAKYRRMIAVYVDITAPLYWWKEFDTYKVGTVANSCSTMHKIHAFELSRDDCSCERLTSRSMVVLESVLSEVNFWRSIYINGGRWGGVDYEPRDKRAWVQMIQLLPSSYNQKRTVMLNYEVLAGIYPMRKNHKLDEWHVFCEWIESLPWSEIIIGEKEKNDEIQTV